MVLIVIIFGIFVHIETSDLPNIDRSALALAELPALDKGDPPEVIADTLPEINPDDYAGEIVIATAEEVITMTVDEDGTKRFTNHFITSVG